MRAVINYPDWKFPSKWAEEYSPLCEWMIFGEYRDGDDNLISVDIAEANPSARDVITRISPEIATKIVVLRRKFAADLMDVLAGREP